MDPPKPVNGEHTKEGSKPPPNPQPQPQPPTDEGDGYFRMDKIMDGINENRSKEKTGEFDRPCKAPFTDPLEMVLSVGYQCGNR